MSRKPNEDDLEMDQVAESELERLERQYRIMEGDRIIFCKIIRREITAQRKTINELKVIKNDLELNLSIIKNPLNKLKDNEAALQLSNLLKLKSKNSSEIKTYKSQVDELKQQIQRVERELSKLRKNDVSDSQIVNKSHEHEQTIANLENRLNVVTVRYNKIMEHNSKLRLDVDHLLKERCLYNSMSKQMNDQLSSGKKTVVELIEQSSLAYDQRDEAQVKLKALKERNRQDFLLHSQEMRELERKLDHDTKLHTFLQVKGEKRVMSDLEAREAEKKKAQREAMEAMISKYESILAHIQKFTTETDVDRLAAKFVKQEEENFALFNYVNEVNSEVELMHDQVKDVQLKISDQLEMNKQRTEEQEETLTILQQALAECTAEATEEKKTLDLSRAVFDTLLANIQLVFKMIGGNDIPILQLLGPKAVVTSNNVMLYLRLVGRRIDELVRRAAQRRAEPRLPDLKLTEAPRHATFRVPSPRETAAFLTSGA